MEGYLTAGFVAAAIQQPDFVLRRALWPHELGAT